VLALVVEGKTNKQIGAELALSEKTVRNSSATPSEARRHAALAGRGESFGQQRHR